MVKVRKSLAGLFFGGSFPTSRKMSTVVKKKGSDLTGKKIEDLAILEQQEGSA